MMLAAHLFARAPADGVANEATFEDALAGALLDADGELHGRWDALTVSQRRAIAALAGGEAPFSQTAARQHGQSSPSRLAAGSAAAAKRVGWLAFRPDGVWHGSPGCVR